MRPPRGLAHRLSGEGGFTLSEMVTVLAILGIVLSGLLAVFVSGTKAETDMNKRFQAEQQSRLALTALRNEIHCASSATTNVTGSALTLSLGAYCSNPPAAGTYQVTYCTALLGPQRYGLFRQLGAPATCDGTGTKEADYLVCGTLFATCGTFFGYSAASGIMPRILVDLPVNVDPTSPAHTYELQDAIALRNATRPA
jgi:prepilin-type N-terminal cleavage/methylation domain-containing protein